VPPAAHRTVVDRPGLPPARTAVLGTSAPHPHDRRLGAEEDPDHPDAGYGQHPIECGGDAHVSSLVARFAWSLSETTRATRARRIANRPGPRAGFISLLLATPSPRRASRVHYVSLRLPLTPSFCHKDPRKPEESQIILPIDNGRDSDQRISNLDMKDHKMSEEPPNALDPRTQFELDCRAPKYAGMRYVLANGRGFTPSRRPKGVRRRAAKQRRNAAG